MRKADQLRSAFNKHPAPLIIPWGLLHGVFPLSRIVQTVPKQIYSAKWCCSYFKNWTNASLTHASNDYLLLLFAELLYTPYQKIHSQQGVRSCNELGPRLLLTYSPWALVMKRHTAPWEQQNNSNQYCCSCPGLSVVVPIISNEVVKALGRILASSHSDGGGGIQPFWLQNYCTALLLKSIQKLPLKNFTFIILVFKFLPINSRWHICLLRTHQHVSLTSLKHWPHSALAKPGMIAGSSLLRMQS